MGLYQRFGSHPGSAVPVTIIPIDTLPASGKTQVRISDIGVAASAASANSVVMVQLSNDGFVLSNVEVSRIEIPTSGTVFKSLFRPIRVLPGQSVRVQFSQGTPGTIAVELFGETNTLEDITDI